MRRTGKVSIKTKEERKESIKKLIQNKDNPDYVHETKADPIIPKKSKKTTKEKEDPDFIPLSQQDENFHIPEFDIGRKRMAKNANPNIISYQEAKEVVRAEGIQSATQYTRWHEKERPKTMPKFPSRAYKHDWTNWGDFLGVYNEFGVKPKQYRTFVEAVKYANELGLQTKDQWTEYYKTSGEVPDDIPGRPDLYYDKYWRGWRFWLGSTPSQRIEVKDLIKKYPIFYIIRETGDLTKPINVYHIGLHRDTFVSLKKRWDNIPCQVFRLYCFNDEKSTEIKQILEYFSSKYYDEDRIRIVPNINAMLWELDRLMEPLPEHAKSDEYTVSDFDFTI